MSLEDISFSSWSNTWGRLSEETGALWLAGNTQIKVAGHAHITTPQNLMHPPPHQPPHIHICAERTREHVCAFTPAHVHWECRVAISLLPLPLLEAMGNWRLCSLISHLGEPARRPSIFAYNLHVLTQPFPSLHRAFPS